MGKPTTQNNSFINHFSHPHRLQLTPATSSPPCSACKLAGGSGRVYSCRPCNFSLHESCSKMKQVITHPSHPSHTLTLLVAPIYNGGYFNCDGCGIIGTGFSYQCSRCDFDIHALCAYKPLSIIHNSHPHHNLKLAFHSPYGASKGFSCDICHNIGKNQWLYRCIPCEFDAHVGCITASSGQHQPPLQHSISAPTPNIHHAGHTQQNSHPLPNQGNNRPMPRPITSPNRPIVNPNRPMYGPRRQINNLVSNGQVGPVGQDGESFGQGSTNESRYNGVYEGTEDVEANEEDRLEILSCGDDYGVARSESEFGGSSDVRSQCNDSSDADLYPPPSLDITQRPVSMNQNGLNAGSSNMGLNEPSGNLNGHQTSDPLAFNGPPGFNGPSGCPSNAIEGGAYNDNYNEVDGAEMYGGNYGNGTEMYGGDYEENYCDDYVGGDGDCDFEAGGDFVDDYDEPYGENNFECFNDIHGGSECMNDGDESYETMDDSQYSGLNDETNNQYLPVVGPVGGPRINNQNRYSQTGRPSNMGIYGRGGSINMNRGANNIQPRTMDRTVQYRTNVGSYRTNQRPSGPTRGFNGPTRTPNGPIGGPNGPNTLGNTMLNKIVQDVAINMLIGGIGGCDINGGAGDGGSSIMGDLFGGGLEI